MATIIDKLYDIEGQLKPWQQNDARKWWESHAEEIDDPSLGLKQG